MVRGDIIHWGPYRHGISAYDISSSSSLFHWCGPHGGRLGVLLFMVIAVLLWLQLFGLDTRARIPFAAIVRCFFFFSHSLRI